MDSKLDLTSEQKAALEKMKEIAGDLFFESWINESLEHLDVLHGLTSVLGQLYGEVIRQTRGREELRNKVTTTFMHAMAIEPNFGREEVLRDAGAEAREEKSPGQLLYEKERARKPGIVAWDRLHPSYHEGYEAKAKERAVMEKILDAPVGAPLPPDSPFATIDWTADQRAQVEVALRDAGKPCWKCTGTGNMSLLGEYEKCDACG